MTSTFITRQRVKALHQLVSQRRAEFALGSKKRKKAKNRRRLLTAAGIGIGGAAGMAGAAGLAGMIRRRGSSGGVSSISAPAISSVAPKNVTSQSTISSVASPPIQSVSRKSNSPEESIVIAPASREDKRRLNSRYVAYKKAQYLGGKTVGDIRKRKKRFYNTQRVLTRRRDLGSAGYGLRDLQAKRQNLKRAIVNKKYGSRKELRQLGRDYAKTSQKIVGAKRDVAKAQNPDLYRRLDSLESYLIASGRGRTK